MQDIVILLRCFTSVKGLKLIAYAFVLLIGFMFYALLLSTYGAKLASASSPVRIKDIVTVEGIRENALVGYCLVVGLNGTGDKMNNSIFTEKSLQSFLEHLGVNTSDSRLKAKNVAAVVVTASLPTFARAGGAMDVTVSTLGDASSLAGGMLVSTPLRGADGQIYAMAQGAVAIGGFEASGGSGSSISKGVPTTGFVSNGATVEREVAFELNQLDELDLALRNPDIATAKRIKEAINQHFPDIPAQMMDPGTVRVVVPEEYHDRVAMMLSEIEQLTVVPEQSAKIIIDESSGTIVMNEDVRISTVAIAQGNLVVRVSETPLVSQPGAFSGGETAIVPGTQVEVEEEPGRRMAIMESGPTLQDLVSGLNALGIGPRDLITILQTIKVAGALQAEIEMR